MLPTTMCWRACSTLARRGFSTTSRQLQTNTGFAERSTEAQVLKKRMGGIGGGIIGFVIGASAAGTMSYFSLLEEYQIASTKLLGAVEELQASTSQVKEHAKKIEDLDQELIVLKDNIVKKEQVDKARRELRKLYDSANIEHLELKTHVWAMEQEIHSNSALKEAD
ncbi:hypothetical protein K493DRAFT_411687 [Basidiobolus meristosporus CBS 931.73]|uniref:Uncharacterized protein n=1 Tax=Basidiobolus meristosporus CBS 931.73 TaxID=1314790 RepID=A0A1Y1XBT8_9FUNG|nr:hypothetical protein K493DRAFT_411687 [Basidiobolus meristosporus CBS 931.73]|eukprot:ORX83251.1 hypothetical protein K493DRAFT_411687 [Basidiobolus meristosporus CBS 931.73]